MGDYKHVIQVPVVVNSNTAQVLVVTEIPLTPSAFRIEQIQKLIEIDESITGQIVVKETERRLADVTAQSPFHDLMIEVMTARQALQS